MTGSCKLQLEQNNTDCILVETKKCCIFCHFKDVITYTFIICINYVLIDKIIPPQDSCEWYWFTKTIVHKKNDNELTVSTPARSISVILA